MSTDFAWLTEHSCEIQAKYAGNWIAVRNGRVVGVGQTAPEAAKAARETAPNEPFILERVESNPERV